MLDEGYIKYRQHFAEAKALGAETIEELNEFRNRLCGMGLIGAYDDGIGFGNISARFNGNQFIISGTQTGHIPTLGAEHYTLITGYDIDQNELWCEGPVRASSESLTHAAVYELSPTIGAVIHVHSKELWNRHLHSKPTTLAEVAYGTPEMAYEVKRLYREGGMDKVPAMIMAGHEEGVVTFGENLPAAFAELEKLMQ